MDFAFPWWALALAGSVFGSLNWWLDYVVMKDVHDSRTVAALHALVSLVPLVAYAWLARLAWPAPDLWAWVFLRGLLFTIFGLLWLEGVRVSELSLNGPLSRMRLFFVILLSVAFLGEALTWSKLASLALVVVGVSVATSTRGKSLRESFRHPALKYFASAALLIAFAVIIDKHLAGQYEPVTYIAGWMAVTAALTFAIISKPLERSLNVLRAKPRAFALRAFVLPAAQLGPLFAYQVGQASLVNLVSEMTVPFSFVLAVWWLHERKNWKRRALGALCVVAATILTIITST